MIRKRVVIKISLFLLAIFAVRTIVSPSCAFAAYTETTSNVADATYYIHQDYLGSVVAVSDESGNNVEYSKYAPYGKSFDSAQDKPAGLERGYTGQIADKNTQLAYYNARYYDPVLSRFISADSVNDGQNRFAYVKGNPISNNDPSGHSGPCPPEIKPIFSGCQEYTEEELQQKQNSNSLNRVVATTADLVSSVLRNTLETTNSPWANINKSNLELGLGMFEEAFGLNSYNKKTFSFEKEMAVRSTMLMDVNIGGVNFTTGDSSADSMAQGLYKGYARSNDYRLANLYNSGNTEQIMNQLAYDMRSQYPNVSFQPVQVAQQTIQAPAVSAQNPAGPGHLGIYQRPQAQPPAPYQATGNDPILNKLNSLSKDWKAAVNGGAGDPLQISNEILKLLQTSNHGFFPVPWH